VNIFGKEYQNSHYYKEFHNTNRQFSILQKMQKIGKDLSYTKLYFLATSILKYKKSKKSLFLTMDTKIEMHLL
jgi:hypothetical protein